MNTNLGGGIYLTPGANVGSNVALPNNVGQVDPGMLRYMATKKRSNKEEGKRQYVWSNPHFASPGAPMPYAFNDSFYNVSHVQLVLRPTTFDFNDTQRNAAFNAMNTGLLRKIRLGMDSPTIKFAMRNKFDSLDDWEDYTNEMNDRKFPSNSRKALGNQLGNFTNSFNPASAKGEDEIDKELARHTMYHEWLSRLLTMVATVDINGMMTEYVERAMLNPMIEDITGRRLDIIPCFDWGTLNTNSPEFYKSLNLTEAELRFLNNKVLRVLENEGFENETNPFEEGEEAHAQWDINHPQQVAYKTATEEFFIGYFVLSFEQKEVINAIVSELDKILKLMLQSTCKHNIITEHVHVGTSLDNIKGIDILRNMHRRYNDVTPNDLSLYEIKLGEFTFEDVTKNPSWKIKQWKPLYDILLKHGKINEQHAVHKLVTSLHPSYRLKAQMLDSSIYHKLHKDLIDNMTIQVFFDEMLREHAATAKSKPKQPNQSNQGPKRKVAHSTHKVTKKKGKPSYAAKPKFDAKKNPTIKGIYGEKDKFKFGKPEVNPKATKDQCGYCGKGNHPNDRCFLVTPGAIPANWWCKSCESYFDKAGEGHRNCPKDTVNFTQKTRKSTKMVVDKDTAWPVNGSDSECYLSDSDDQ